MEMSTFGIFNKFGRMAGCYVYMLMCQDDGSVYVKVGISEHPTKRLKQLWTNCAVTPRVFAVIETKSRRRAIKIEQKLHKSLTKWRTVGEWFSVSMEDKPEFRDACKKVLQGFNDDPTRPVEWTFVSIDKMREEIDARRKFLAKKHVRRRSGRGLAYQDFRSACKR